MPALILSASRSAQCYSEARAAFNRTYSKTNFFIDGTNGGVLDYNKQIVRIQNFNVTQNMLNKFGDMVQFLNISFADMNQVKSSEIVKSITANSSDSLKELYLNHCYGKVLNQMNRPFWNVTIASFTTRYRFESGSNALKLNKLLPKLKRLHIRVDNIDNLEFVGDQFLELRSLILDIPEQINMPLSAIENLFRASPKINTLTIYRTSLNLLRIANRLLPNLKVLRLFEFSYDYFAGNQIRFKHVIHLHITSTREYKSNRIPYYLVFHQLRKVSLNIDFDFTDDWIYFLDRDDRTNNIEVIDVKTKSITTELMNLFGEHLPNTKVASITSEQKISADAIIGLLNQCKQLLNLQIQVALMDVAERKHLDESLQHEWDISSTYPSINVIAFTFSR